MSSLTPKSRSIVLRLSGLFAIDSFAGGFMIQSIVSFWFFTRFGADLTTLSYIFSVSGVLTAFSFMAAAKIADRIGLINTMVFTHIPANILIIAVAFAPTLPMAVVLYLLRMALSQMDVPTRQSYIVAVVRDRRKNSFCWHYKYFKKCDSSYKSFINRYSHKLSQFGCSFCYWRCT